MAERARKSGQKGVTEALRAAGKRARAGSSALRGERATQLLDEVARHGHRARDELSRRSQRARDEVAAQLEALERRLARLEDALRAKSKPEAED